MDHDANTTFCRICDAVLAGNGWDATTMSQLDGLAKDLVLDDRLRVHMGTSNPSIWPGIHQAWNVLARRVASDESDASTRCLITSLARFTRNLVAAVPSNQQNAFASEPSLRHILYLYSSWAAIQDSQLYQATRMLVQTLSNIVTSNDGLMNRLWEIHLNLPEGRIVFIRLLDSPDTRTILSLLVLLVNCIHESKYRRELLVETQVGVRLCITLLDRMVTLHDAEESSDEGKVFDYLYRLFAHLFDGGSTPKLYANLKVPGEIITPHQTTLLKLLDSHLHSSRVAAALVGMCPMLTTCFIELCAFSIQAMRTPIRMNNVAEDDDNLPVLPKVCEALVLVTQCLISALLEAEGNCIESSSKDEPLLIRNAVLLHGEEMVVCTIELLRLLDDFLPRINFGKPILSFRATQSIPRVMDSAGFFYVKRDLVRLLGILCYKNRKIQDSIRDCEGITVVMNMCVVDERNPYLREHAILTLHNLLEENKDNQTVVDSIQPSKSLPR